MKRVASIVLSVLICFAAVPWSSFAVQTAPVTGTVTDSKGNPVGGAKVVATDDKGANIGSAVTNEQGQYSMLLPVGEKYTLNVEPPPPFEKPAHGFTQPMLAASGAVVNATVPSGPGPVVTGAAVGGGLLTVAGSVGAAIGTTSNPGKRTFTGSPSN